MTVFPLLEIVECVWWKLKSLQRFVRLAYLVGLVNRWGPWGRTDEPIFLDKFIFAARKQKRDNGIQ